MHYSPDVIVDRNFLINNLSWLFIGDTQGTCSLGVDSYLKTAVKIYPNPVQNQITINGLKGDETLMLYDFNGRLLQTLKVHHENEILKMGKYTNGIYFLKIGSAGNATLCKKIIKQGLN